MTHNISSKLCILIQTSLFLRTSKCTGISYYNIICSQHCPSFFFQKKWHTSLVSFTGCWPYLLLSSEYLITISPQTIPTHTALLLHCIDWDFSKQVLWNQISWNCYSHLCACKPVLTTANGFKPVSDEESDSDIRSDLSTPALDSATHTWCGSSVSKLQFSLYLWALISPLEHMSRSFLEFLHSRQQ